MDSSPRKDVKTRRQYRLEVGVKRRLKEKMTKALTDVKLPIR